MGEKPPVSPALLLGAVTIVQLLATFSVLALPTLAPVAAATFGVGPQAVGYQLSLVYLAASILSSVSGLYVRRYGAVTMSAAALVTAALGLAGIASGHIIGAALASIMLGACYAFTNPAASHLLLRFGPKSRQSLVFAVKQSGVPIGGILGALALPPLAAWLGWQIAMLAGVVLLLVVALLLLPWRWALDDDMIATARVRGSALAGARLAWSTPTLRALAIMGLCYASFQFCLMSFAISMLVADLGWGLIAAGSVVGAMQAGGAIGRISWSVLADSTGRGLVILATIGVLSVALVLALGLLDRSWPPGLLIALLMGLAFCSIGWNGVYMSEVAKAVPASEVGLATGGVLVYNFAGVTVGPTLFALTYTLVGSYAATYALFAILPVGGTIAILALIRGRAKASHL